ncbi:uncharacterized protein LOC131694739 isoform X2 [Topomyia yanbarensis]|uniref:uncharacterized protein LOC131694739 isoform X2 n=1 Tax=Topomyia yanbarensis TaxID=2498891 RepID=UPI00273A9100|nr:uncharacterized protein LOC131694739 isoform X2 [Topomyia yanbarensis]
MTLRMAVHSVVDGKIIKHMVMVFARVQKIKVPTSVLGITALKFQEFTFGQADLRTKGTGRMEKDMVLVSKPEADGSIEENGRRVSKDGMASGKVCHLLLNMKVLGQMACRTDMDLKRMRMEEVTKANGYEVCGTGMVCERQHRLGWRPDSERKISELL